MYIFLKDGDSPHCGAYVKGGKVPEDLPGKTRRAWITAGIIREEAKGGIPGDGSKKKAKEVKGEGSTSDKG